MSGREQRLHNAAVMVMFLAVYNQYALTQQIGNRITWAAPEQLLPFSNQYPAVCQGTPYDISPKSWQRDLKKPLHPAEQDLHGWQGRSFPHKTFQNETKGLGVNGLRSWL
jgi:hypothetical protein